MTARKAEVGPKSVRAVKLTLSELGGEGSSVEVDGKDVSGLVRGVTVVSTVGDVTVVRLELVKVTVQGDVAGRVDVDAPTRDFLRSLGWTPPEA